MKHLTLPITTVLAIWAVTIFGFVMTVVACGNDNPTNSVRIVTYEEYLMLKPAGHAGAPDLRDAWKIIGDEGKLKSKRGGGFTWIWANSDGSYVECNFDGPVCFDREGEITSNGRPYDVDWCFESLQYMRSCSQSGL